MFNITGVFTEQGPGSGVHRGAHICLRSSHPSWSSVGFRIFDRSLFLTALFSITPGLHHTWGCYIVMNNLAAESKLGWNSSDTFRENFKFLERWLAFSATWRVKWGTIRGGGASCLIFGSIEGKTLSILEDGMKDIQALPSIMFSPDNLWRCLYFYTFFFKLLLKMGNFAFPCNTFTCRSWIWSTWLVPVWFRASGEHAPLVQIHFVSLVKDWNASFFPPIEKQSHCKWAVEDE